MTLDDRSTGGLGGLPGEPPNFTDPDADLDFRATESSAVADASMGMGGTPGGDAGTGADVKDRAASVASTGAESAKQVAGDAKEQAKAVASHTKAQLDDLVGQTRSEVRRQADERSSQAASGLRSLSSQLDALASGRTEEAGALSGYLDEARSRVDSWAGRLEQGGAQGLVDDVTDFARRRPGLFLAGAVAAGFAAGRLVKAARAESSDSDDQYSTQYSTGSADAWAAGGSSLTAGDPLPPPDATDPWVTAQTGVGAVDTSAPMAGSRLEP